MRYVSVKGSMMRALFCLSAIFAGIFTLSTVVHYLNYNTLVPGVLQSPLVLALALYGLKKTGTKTTFYGLPLPFIKPK